MSTEDLGHGMTAHEVERFRANRAAASNKWKIEGYDTFDASSYPLAGEYDSEDDAKQAARNRLSELETNQPSSTSGGQSGIQDRVYIVNPNGNKYRFFG